MSRRAGRRAVARGRTGDADPGAAATSRLDAVDAARGIAIALMIGYHFGFDLRHFGIIAADFEHDPLWLSLRALILSSFLLLVGVSLALAERAGAPAGRFWRRIATVALGALLVSLASLLLFPASTIYFGVLHCIAVTSLLARPLAGRPVLAVLLGCAVLAVGATLAHPAFDARLLSPIGFGTYKPRTEDYVPLAPWAGVVLIGIGIGHLVDRHRAAPLLSPFAMPRWLVWPGRHSLAIYLLHQPLLFAVLAIATRS